MAPNIKSKPTIPLSAKINWLSFHNFRLFNFLWRFLINCKLTFSLTNIFFNELEIFNICDKSIFVFICLLENRISKISISCNSQKFISIVDKCQKFIMSNFSLGTIRYLSLFVHFLETHLSAMSFEQKVSLNKLKNYELEEVNLATSIRVDSEHVFDNIVNLLLRGLSKSISNNGFNLGGFNLARCSSPFVKNNLKLVPKLIL